MQNCVLGTSNYGSKDYVYNSWNPLGGIFDNNLFFDDQNNGFQNLNSFCNSGRCAAYDHQALIGLDPLFFSSQNYRLNDKSPAISAGIPLPEVTEDIEGNLRPLGEPVDIGAYQHSN